MDINSYIADLPSVESSSFEEYAKLMKLYILTAKKSDSFEGTKKLLTELYPDNAHFIYELLQNAEDAEAESVHFELKKDMLIFRHNGKKEFTLKDVKGITSIGNSTKKDDHTKVGKFGVGFKSVFAFTDMPKIYSGNFNFEIQDMLIPVKIKPNNKRKMNETYFEFPFKGGLDEVRKYIMQIERELQSLDANTIMFLDNIKTIEYDLVNGKKGNVQKEKISENVFQIDVSSKCEKTLWLIFEKDINSSEKDSKSKLHVNISYALKKNVDKWDIVPTDGTVNIFFPAVKETSGLRFNINGPFASTVARDSIRECEENTLIFDAITELIIESLMFCRKHDLISMGLYESMPNNEDLLAGNYIGIRDKVLDTFNNYELVLSASGDFYKAPDLIKTLPGIQNLFSFAEIKKLMGFTEADWCCTVPVRNKNCRAFFDSLNIRNYSYRTMSKLFDDEHKIYFEKIIEHKSLPWFRNLYLVLIDLKNFYQEGKLMVQYPILQCNMKKTKMIMAESGKLKTAEGIYVSQSETVGDTDIFVNERFKKFSELEPFWQMLDISIYNDEATAQFILQQLEKYQYPTEEYYSDLFNLAKYAAHIEAEKISSHKIWFAEGEKKKYSADYLYLDEPYENTGYSNIAAVISDTYELSSIYIKHYDAQSLDIIIAFIKSLGIRTGLEITKSDVKKNPLYHELLYRYSDNITAHSTSEDYSIRGLDDFLDARNIEVSKMVWNFMISLHTLPRFCKASFSPNRTTQPRKCDSYLIQRLRDRAWVPSSVDGRFYKPADVSLEMLPDGFDWKDDSIFVNLILFATDKNKVKIQSEKLINDWGVDTESEQAQALRALLSNPQMAGRILNLVDKEEEFQYSLSEAIDAQSRVGIVNEEDYDEESIYIRNVERRSKKIREELEEGLTKPILLKKIGFVSRTKTSPEEKTYLLEQYHGRCQICGQTIKKWNGQNYFEGINLIDTKKLDRKLKNSLEIGWNSLCLCPNHAAEYKYGAIDLTDLEKNIMSTPVTDRCSESIGLPILMQGIEVKIVYTPKHFLALKTAFEFFLNLEK